VVGMGERTWIQSARHEVFDDGLHGHTI